MTPGEARARVVVAAIIVKLRQVRGLRWALDELGEDASREREFIRRMRRAALAALEKAP